MALGELLAVGAVQQRQVGVARRLVAEGGEDEQLLGRVGEVVVAADDVGDPHLGVVDRDGEVVEDAAVAAGDHEVVVARFGKETGPRIRSSTTVSPASGTRSRTAAPGSSVGVPR